MIDMADSNPAPDELNEDVVRKVARLSRLAITDDEARTQTSRLTAVLGYIERLQELDLENVEPLNNPLDATNRIDEDTPRESLGTDDLMKMAPGAHPPYVKVPKVLGDGGGA